MSDFPQNIFSQQLGNSQPMQMDPLQPQMNPSIQKIQMLNQISQKTNPDQNQPQLFQMPQQIFNQNPTQNNDANNPNNLESNINPILNFNFNKEPNSQNINNNNNNINSNNVDMNLQNQNQLNDNPQINLNMNMNNMNKNKNKKKKNNKNNPVPNPLSNNESEENNNPEPPKKNKLENKFSFLYRIDDNIQHQSQKQVLAKEKYESQVKKIAEFDTIEDFWDIFQHLRKPDSCRPGIEFFMFKGDIKPLWEDENNKNGGRFSIKLKQGYTTIIWEEMIFTLIGGILPNEIKEEINGIVVTSKKEFNTLQIWFKTFDTKITSEIEKCLRDILVIPPEVKLEPKKFNINVTNNTINNINNNSNSNNDNNTNNNNNNSNNNKKEYGNYNNNKNNNNNKNSNKNNNKNKNKGGEFREKGHYNNKNNNNNNNYYYDYDYDYEDDGYGNYNNNNKDYKKNKYHQRKNKKDY